MQSYVTNITGDSFSGIIFALQGMGHCVVLINGSSGCKFYHSAVSDNQMIKQFEFSPLNYPEKWYFGQPCVPCTSLESDDYIYGSMDKLIESLEFLQNTVPFDLLCIVNSPGAALIGDDLAGIANAIIKDKYLVIIETPGFSSDMCTGHEIGALELLKQLPLHENPPKMPKAVNILGISIFHKYYAGDIAELRRLLALCGIEVSCVLCSERDIEHIKNIGSAALNIIIHPEYGERTAKYLNARFGTPYYTCNGPPIGFTATEKMMSDICMALNADISLFMEESKRARGLAYSHISRVNSLTGLPKGVEFAIEGTYSELYAYTLFLVRYFGMIVECASVQNEHSNCFKGKFEELLIDFGLSGALHQDIMETRSELVFGSGNTIAGLKLRRHEFVGIETCLPTLGYIDIIPKTHLGLLGALTLTEQVLNGLIF